ncbi:hypothetical protein Hdeb2414_s0004g00129371 [Helianthus debilis subsp. tardiflorus]
MFVFSHDPDAKKTNLWMKVAKLAKPQGQKWHLILIFIYNVSYLEIS